MNDEKPVYELVDNDNVPKIEYRIFKTLPFIEGREKYCMPGDPEINGIASGDFVSYKNVAEREKIMNDLGLAVNPIPTHESFVKQEEDKIKKEIQKQGQELIYGKQSIKQAVKLDDVKLEEPVLPSFDDQPDTFAVQSEVNPFDNTEPKKEDDFDYSQIPPFAHD